tara:strand:- start:312 stop:716 length:405 start_codon:yes stop_codon:yes gene_type:complete
MSNKKPHELLQILNNHLFFDEIEDSKVDYFFKVSLFKNKIFLYDDENDTTKIHNDYNENLIKKKMMKFIIEDCKLLFDNIPKVKLVILSNPDLNEEERNNLVEILNNNIDNCNHQLKQININNLINDSYKRILP